MLSHKIHRFILLSLFATLVAACSSGKVVQTYDGSVLAETQQAILIAPDNISLISVNGKALPDYLLSKIDTKYGLRPGMNTVVFKYESVWATRRGGGEDAPRSEVVESEPQVVEFNASAGDTYTFDTPSINNVRDARRYVENFSINLVDALNAEVASSEKYNGVSKPVSVASNNKIFEQVPVLKQVAEQVGAMKADNTVAYQQSQSKLSALDGLKLVWSTATEEEKKAFLVWAFQE